jgi:putative PIN family toxin of toxin-antitoxin system
VIRVVFDANVIASGFPAKSGPLKLVINLWTGGKLDLVISQHILEEVEKTWQKRYWRERFSEEDADDAFTTLNELSDMVWIGDWAPRVA